MRRCASLAVLGSPVWITACLLLAAPATAGRLGPAAPRSAPAARDASRRGRGPGVSDWVPCGVVLTPAITNEVRYQRVHADGAQGAVIAWSDSSAGRLQVHASRLDGTGQFASGWDPGGNPVSLSDSSQLLVSSDTDGGGGGFFLYTDVDPQVDNSHDLYIQHVTSAGVFAGGYPVGGKVLVTGAINVAGMIADGAGGTFFFWSTGGSTIRIKQLDASGAVVAGWPAGGLDTGISDLTFEGEAVADGSGGVFLAWEEVVAGQSIVSIQRFAATGPASGWSAGGLPLGIGSFVTITRLSDGDAMVGWSGDSLRVGRVESTGSLTSGWPAFGRAVNVSGKFAWDPRLVADAVGGAICGWQETVSGAAGPGTLYAQRVTAGFGLSPGWPVAGVPLLTTASALGHSIGALPELTSDGASGAIAAWT